MALLVNACRPTSPLFRDTLKQTEKATKNAIKEKQTPVLSGDSEEASPEPMVETRVALVITDDRAKGIHEAIALLGLGGFTSDRVLLKPNFNSADASPGSTHPITLRALVGELYEMGATSILVGDRSGMGNTRAVMNQIGVDRLAAELGFELVPFDELEDAQWTVIRSSDHYWSDGFAVPRLLLETPRIVQTCNLKTHQYGGHFTMALKNSVGLVAKTTKNQDHDYMRELHSSTHQRKMIADINTAYQPDLIVMDGVEAFVSGGPAKGRTVSPKVILAGTDPVAMDAVGVSILRLFGTTPEVNQGSVFDQEQIARAVELGLGVSSPQGIALLTTGDEGEEFAGQIRSILLA